MASISENLRIWSNPANWESGGNEWSREFASVDAQWFLFLYPRIREFIKPNATILEIAPGYGRWTKYLIPMAKKFIGIDLCANCIDACRTNFAGATNASFIQNDGRTIPMVADSSIDFCFSFDSLVHADRDALEFYIADLFCKLKEGGHAFIHHSNLNQFDGDKKSIKHFRAPEIDYMVVRDLCRKYGLHVKSQELIKWGNEKIYLDCITVIYKNSRVANIDPVLIKDKYLQSLYEYGKYLATNYGFKNDNDFVPGTMMPGMFSPQHPTIPPQKSSLWTRLRRKKPTV